MDPPLVCSRTYGLPFLESLDGWCGLGRLITQCIQIRSVKYVIKIEEGDILLPKPDPLRT